jgi:hypothetical protein
MAATPAVTTTASRATPAAATSATLSLRARLIYHQVPAAEILAVQGVYSAVSIFIALHFDEGKTARLSRETVTNQIDARGSNANLREPFLKLFFRRRKRKIPDVELLHLPTPSARNPRESRGARCRTAIGHGQPGKPNHRGRENWHFSGQRHGLEN